MPPPTGEPPKKLALSPLPDNDWHSGPSLAVPPVDATATGRNDWSSGSLLVPPATGGPPPPAPDTRLVDSTSPDSEWHSQPGLMVPPADDAPRPPGQKEIATAKAMLAALRPLLGNVIPEDDLMEGLMDADHDAEQLFSWVQEQLEHMIRRARKDNDRDRMESLKDIRFDVIQEGTQILC